MKVLYTAIVTVVPAAVTAFSSNSAPLGRTHPTISTTVVLPHSRVPSSKTTFLRSSFVKEPATGFDVVTESTNDDSDQSAPLQHQQQQKQYFTAAESVPRSLSYLDDGFVFGLEGSGLGRPKGKVSQLVVEGDSLETTNWQRAVVWGTFLGHAGFLTTAFAEMLQVNQGNVGLTLIQSVLLMLSSWILADFGSGVLHWSVDNYGNGRTPIMGGIIAAFQGHHSARKL